MKYCSDCHFYLLFYRPIDAHYFPTLHQYKFEVEDGLTSEGAKIRYGYDERIFPGYSWRGYAILTGFQVIVTNNTIAVYSWGP